MFVNNWTIFQTHWNQFTNPAMGVVCFLFCVFLFSFCVFSLVFRGLPVFCLYLFLLRFLRSLSIWYTKIPPKSSKNRPKIESRSLQNFLKSTQNRAQQTPGALLGTIPTTSIQKLVQKMTQDTILEPKLVPNWLPNHIFWRQNPMQHRGQELVEIFAGFLMFLDASNHEKVVFRLDES